MKNIGGSSKYIAFMDECGDHSLDKIDNDFPVFLLAMLVIEREHYIDTIIPRMGRLKLSYWNHEGVNLHSRDIRKASGPFSFLMDSEKRVIFLSELSNIMKDCNYTLFVSAINKQKLMAKYVEAHNPYSLALKFNMERVMNFMKTCGETELPIVAEARGKREDEMLEIEYLRLMTAGSEYISGLTKLECPLVFKNKRDNIAGIQLADLCAYPCARHVLKPEQSNQAYDIVTEHIYKNSTVKGWKVFP
ncbi:MAG: DUF3800 domain-containing protein [Victivallales bacterium]|nr:DUF3800 domain-containing protein [Victivallales bacterium]